jgi:hypothetical protein
LTLSQAITSVRFFVRFFSGFASYHDSADSNSVSFIRSGIAMEAWGFQVIKKNTTRLTQ